MERQPHNVSYITRATGMLFPFHRQGPGWGPAKVTLPSGAAALLGHATPSSLESSSHPSGGAARHCPPSPTAVEPQVTRYRAYVATPALGDPGRSLVPAAADPTPIVPSLLTSEDPVAGPAGPPEASSRRPSKLGRWRQDPRRRTRRLRRLPSSAGAGGGASPSSRDSGDPGGGGCDPCDVERSSPKAVWGRREGETRPPARAARCAPPPARRMRPRASARRGRGPDARARAHQTLPCPHRGGRPSLGRPGTNSAATAKGADTRNLDKLLRFSLV